MFPERVYTEDEVKRARELIELGHKHHLKVEGSESFKMKVEEALAHIRAVGQYDFLRTYVGRIIEVDGLSQLRESEVAIWMNKYAVEDSVDAAGFIIQKAYQMKDFIEGRDYYSGEAELRAMQKRIEFIKTLKEVSNDLNVKRRCNEILNMWEESLLIY